MNKWNDPDYVPIAILILIAVAIAARALIIYLITAQKEPHFEKYQVQTIYFKKS